MSKRRKITLIILLILTALLGVFSVGITYYIQENRSPTTSNASTGPGYTNICGSGTAANWTNRNQCSGCNSGGSCSGNFVYKFYCHGYQTQCGGSGAGPYNQSGPSGSQDKSGSCGDSVQLDVFSGDNFSGLTDYFVYYEGDCSSNPPPGNPLPPPPPAASCPTNYGCSGSSCGFAINAATFVNGNLSRSAGINPGLQALNNSVTLQLTSGENGIRILPAYGGGFSTGETVSFNGPCTNGQTITRDGSTVNNSYNCECMTGVQACLGTYTFSGSVNGNSCGQAKMTVTQAAAASNCNDSCNPNGGSNCPSQYTCLDSTTLTQTSGAGVCRTSNNPYSTTCTQPSVSPTSACITGGSDPSITVNWTQPSDIPSVFSYGVYISDDQATLLLSPKWLRVIVDPSARSMTFPGTTGVLYNDAGAFQQGKTYYVAVSYNVLLKPAAFTQIGSVTTASNCSTTPPPPSGGNCPTTRSEKFTVTTYINGTVSRTQDLPIAQNEFSASYNPPFLGGFTLNANENGIKVDYTRSGYGTGYDTYFLAPCSSGQQKHLTTDGTTNVCDCTTGGVNNCVGSGQTGWSSYNASTTKTSTTITCGAGWFTYNAQAPKYSCNNNGQCVSDPNGSYSASNCNNACTQTVACGQTCDATHLCPSGNTCSGGICTANNCLSPNVCSGGACGTTIACGDVCGPNNACPTGHTCQNGICTANNCLSPNVCSNGSCGTPIACGGACGPNNTCPIGMSCNAGICKQNNCLSPNVCSNGGCGTPINCGDACGPGNTCPTGHTCQSGICTSNSCLSPNVCSNGACGTPISCGQACGPGNTCPTGHTCQSGICTANNCLSPNVCSAGSCGTTIACGDACGPNNSCPSGMTCNSGTCTQNSCLPPALCNNNGGACGTPIACGGACGPGSTCPTGMTCNVGVCKLNTCVSSPGSCSGSCTLASCSDAICNTGESCESTTVGGTTYRSCTAGDISGGTAPTGSLVPSCQMSGGTACQQAAPACGDALCDSGELCEQVAPGSTNFKACTAGNISGHTAPSGGDVPSCQMSGASACQQNPPACGDALCSSGESCESTTVGGSTYKACTAGDISGNSVPTGASVPNCQMTGATSCQQAPVTNMCINLTATGSNPLTSGVGNFEAYTFVYQNANPTDPYPNIRLRVGPNGSPVGRDANATTQQLVAPQPTNGVVHDAIANTWTYRFVWEAADPASVAVPASTYTVSVMLDGTNATEVTTPSGCVGSLTVSPNAQQEPLFTVLKQSAPSCDGNTGDAIINYTITITNIGPITGNVNFVKDNLDSNVVALGINPTNITPSFGTYAAGVINWVGTNSDTTYTTNQQKQFTYQIRVPVNFLSNFKDTGVLNKATVSYDTAITTGNTATFDLRTMLNCTIPAIPNTGILDDARLLFIGLLFILIGYLSYKYKIGYNFAYGLIEGANEKLHNLPFMPYEEGMKNKIKEKIRKTNR